MHSAISYHLKVMELPCVSFMNRELTIPTFKWNGLNLRYSILCSCFYAAGEVVLWDDDKNDELNVIDVPTAEDAQELMNAWVENAPYYINCKISTM